MAHLQVSTEVAGDLDRIHDHLAQYQVADATERLRQILQALNVLELNPLIGRPFSDDADDRRELVIGRRGRGYLALYRYVAALDTVFVLALRAQAEAGYFER